MSNGPRSSGSGERVNSIVYEIVHLCQRKTMLLKPAITDYSLDKRQNDIFRLVASAKNILHGSWVTLSTQRLHPQG